jgi:hypothetical protein
MRLPFNGSYPTTQTFNDPCCRAAYAQFGMIGHNGIDYGLPTGTPVVAVEAGTIRSGFEANGYGRFIFLTNDTGTQFVYGHLSVIQVASGRVSAGQQIGLSGNTGNSSGPHLHFGIRPPNSNNNNGFLGYVDPLPYFQGGSSNMSNKNTANMLCKAVMYVEPESIGTGIEYLMNIPCEDAIYRAWHTPQGREIYKRVYQWEAVNKERDDYKKQADVLKAENEALKQQLESAGFKQSDRDTLNRVDKNTGGN